VTHVEGRKTSASGGSVLGTIVGGTTAGTNGGMNPFDVAGGHTLRWTGMDVRRW